MFRRFRFGARQGVRRPYAQLIGVGLAVAATPCGAAIYAAPSSAHDALPGAAGGLLRVTLGLAVVLAAVFVAAWLSRRLRSGAGAGSAGLSVLAQVPLGPRERAVLMRVGTRQVLVGVAHGCVRTLHVLEPAEATIDGDATASSQAGAAGALPGRPSFKALLRKSLGR